jgi:magnesium transporter
MSRWSSTPPTAATPSGLRELVHALDPADVADLMGFLSAAYREEVIPVLDPEWLGEIIAELDDNLREEVLEATPSATLARALEELDSDDAADVIDDLDEGKRAQVLAAMDEGDRAAIETTLSYEDETAGRLMQREFLAAPQFWTVGQTIDHVRVSGDHLPELFFDVYVVDPTFTPVGALPISLLLTSKLETPLAEIMEPVTEIAVDMDQEEVAYIFDKYHLISAPVVESGRAAGGPDHRRRHRRASSARRPRRTSWPWPASATRAATRRSTTSSARACRGCC